MELCLLKLHLGSDDLNSDFQVKSYSVNFTDVTGEVSKMISLPRSENNTCTLYPNSVVELKPEVCSPFDVSVAAKNDDGWSNSTEKK